jgi:hypothetical protein
VPESFSSFKTIAMKEADFAKNQSLFCRSRYRPIFCEHLMTDDFLDFAKSSPQDDREWDFFRAYAVLAVSLIPPAVFFLDKTGIVAIPAMILFFLIGLFTLVSLLAAILNWPSTVQSDWRARLILYVALLIALLNVSGLAVFMISAGPLRGIAPNSH